MSNRIATIEAELEKVRAFKNKLVEAQHYDRAQEQRTKELELMKQLEDLKNQS